MFSYQDYTFNTTVVEVIQYLQSILTNGKLSNYKVTSSGISIPCPSHSDGCEKHNSCYINEDGVFHCFTCGVKGNIVKFVSLCLNVSLDKALSWLLSHFSNTQLKLKTNDLQLQKDIKLAKILPTSLDESILNGFQNFHPYMLQRKLNLDVCKRFQIKYDCKTKCLVFPVWDENDNLVMLTRRSVEKKHFYIDKNCEKPVYLLNFCKNINSVCVCESQINALYLWSLNIPAVSLFGTGTLHQYEILNKSHIRHYVLCFDGDAAGDKGIKNFIKHIRKDVIVDVATIPRSKDINDLDGDTIKKIISECSE